MPTSAPAPLMALLRSVDAATLLGIEPQTLRVWRLRGVGPAYVRVGAGLRGRVLYRPEELARWIERRTFTNTAEESAGLPRPGRGLERRARR